MAGSRFSLSFEMKICLNPKLVDMLTFSRPFTSFKVEFLGVVCANEPRIFWEDDDWILRRPAIASSWCSMISVRSHITKRCPNGVASMQLVLQDHSMKQSQHEITMVAGSVGIAATHVVEMLSTERGSQFRVVDARGLGRDGDILKTRRSLSAYRGR